MRATANCFEQIVVCLQI